NNITYFGVTIGRVANRIGGAQFTLNGIHYKLIANEGNCIYQTVLSSTATSSL
ncbi:hypothetical protein S245_052872, partial [Arachis hypogaea]